MALLLPETVAPSVRRQFEQLLTSLTALVQQPSEAPPGAAPAAARTPEQKERLAAVMSGGLVKGGWTVWGMGCACVCVGGGVRVVWLAGRGRPWDRAGRALVVVSTVANSMI